MEPAAQAPQPDTVTNGVPIAPDVISGTASVEPGTVAPATTTESPGVIDRFKGLFVGSNVAQPDQAVTTTPQVGIETTPEAVLSAGSTPISPPTETASSTDTGPMPGVEPAGGPDFSTDTSSTPPAVVEPAPTPWMTNPTWPHIENTPSTTPAESSRILDETRIPGSDNPASPSPDTTGETSAKPDSALDAAVSEEPTIPTPLDSLTSGTEGVLPPGTISEIRGIPPEVLEEAADKARKSFIEIVGEMTGQNGRPPSSTVSSDLSPDSVRDLGAGALDSKLTGH